MIVTVDFETTYSREYSLSRMSEVDYILDPRFQTIMCSIKRGRRETQLYIGHWQVQQALAEIDWEECAFLSHNTRFDGSIALWHFNVRPKMYLCTLSMARATTHIAAGGSSLAKVSRYLGLPEKGHQVESYIGYRLENFTDDQLADYGAYCMRDNDNCRAIFDRLRPCIPHSELELIDLTLRKYIEPQVKLSETKLTAHLAGVQQEVADAFKKVAHLDRAIFSSNLKFADLLQSMGVVLPTKISPATGKEMPALARNDPGFRELCEDDSQPVTVQAVLAARMRAKSTIEETRTATLLNLSRRQWGDTQGWAPIPLKYYGAHTGRPSGDGGFNFLNFKRGSPIRDAIEAPPGWRIVHRDSSQIEARMVAWLARCQRLLHAFAQGRDIYSEFATQVYGRLVTKASVGDRFVGKTSILGLGYGMGPERFMHTLFIGNGGISIKVDLKEATRIVWLYRRMYPEITQLWSASETMLYEMLHKIDPFKHVFATTVANAFPHIVDRLPQFSDNALWLPNGMPIQYLGLDVTKNIGVGGAVTHDVTYDGGPGKGRVKLFGGKVTENISQAYARIVITDVAVRVRRASGWRPFLTTYDSLDYVVPESEAEQFDHYLEDEFRRRPTWAPDLPLASEGGWGKTLMEAERALNQ